MKTFMTICASVALSIAFVALTDGKTDAAVFGFFGAGSAILWLILNRLGEKTK